MTRPGLFVCALLSILPLSNSQEQPGLGSAPAQTASPAVPNVNYPDSTSGLEHIVRDIMKAQKDNDGARADVLLKRFVLPNPREWYDQVFGGDVAEVPESLYEKSAASIPPSMAQFFVAAQTSGMTEVRAVRFDSSCDDNAGEDAFGVLYARVQLVPFYELRLLRGDKFTRLFAFAYVDGAFRYIVTPKMEGAVFGHPRPTPAPDHLNTNSNAQDPSEIRVKIGGPVQAAKLVKRVQPHYPEVARREHLQGTVKLHALIGKDGSLRTVYVVKGYCSLAEASLEAVRQWRYSPTTLNGKPVEIDTEIDVTYSLSP